MLSYYPAIRPYAKHALKVGKIHQLYIEESGEPTGLPVLFLHGGPGFGCSDQSRRFFDPMIYRIIAFDQRGCGRSTPYGSIEENTTQDLIQDIEKIRELLNIDRWIIFGGSWGATLGLAYAETYPEKVMGLILRGVFLNREQDIHWIYRDGMNHMFPDFWEDFISHIPKAEQHDLIQANYIRVTGKDDLMRMTAAKAWALWEARCATLDPSPQLLEELSDPKRAVPFARISCHYFKNHLFLEPNQILQNIAAIQKIPGIIVHGRYDMLTPLEHAWELHKAWPSSQLNIIRDAGHAAAEPAIVDALVRATKSMAHRYTAA
ncbi:MAG: prolyl aminopeptidase [Legionellales bacterium]|nr:prolyl aminopeptidase [Legionellales bacterium]